MAEIEDKQKQLIAFFRQLVETKGGGIFTTKTRKRLLGMKGVSGRDRTINDFWNDVRKRVRNAQTDLQLFILTSEKEQINQAITTGTLVPAIRALLDSRNSDLNRAEIARLFISEGFSYLQGTSGGNITLAHSRTITEALDLANYLVANYPVK